ncbi:exosome complex component RRP45-like [Cimex lectularius]|uniref:Exosome complex component RRP45 n=1 Tax=Cimex lectularius TaxID=79782 RepID=A0A8I6S0J2_CIMLE|nr:exosome complex component RRP45-like [Cimex lectularius]
MRDTVVSNCEARFLNQAIDNNLRLDGRQFDEYRNLELHFGSEYGCVYVALGETKCLAQVSCELAEPRFIRQNEGNLFINVEISDMVCSNFETGQQSHLQAHANRLLEKCFKDARCIDLEALCIISGEQAWEIRVDVTVLNYDGNIHTCCSVATLAALAHFRTPRVTVEDSVVIVHSLREHEPLPLSLHHFPVLMSFAVFKKGTVTVVDPTELEEKVSEAELVVGVNSYYELCGMHYRGDGIADGGLIVSRAHDAAEAGLKIINTVKACLEKDSALRSAGKGKTPGLTEIIDLDRILSACQDRNSVKLTVNSIGQSLKGLRLMDTGGGDSDEEGEESGESSSSEESKYKKNYASVDKRKGVVLKPMEADRVLKQWVPTGTNNSWDVPNAVIDESAVSSESDDDNDVNYVRTITDEDRIIDKIELSGESEEEEVVVLRGNDMT